MFTKEEIRRLKRGDRVLFRRLFDDTSRELIAWVSLFVERTEAKDVVQDLYIHLMTFDSGLRPANYIGYDRSFIS